jgi:hypothetical protein
MAEGGPAIVIAVALPTWTPIAAIDVRHHQESLLLLAPRQAIVYLDP